MAECKCNLPWQYVSIKGCKNCPKFCETCGARGCEKCIYPKKLTYNSQCIAECPTIDGERCDTCESVIERATSMSALTKINRVTYSKNETLITAIDRRDRLAALEKLKTFLLFNKFC